jgi:hypothetical protein
MALNDKQALTLTSAAVLLGRVGEILSDFDRELLLEVGRRWVKHRRQIHVTDHEWQVVVRAIDFMRAEIERRRAAAAEAA